MRLPRWLDTLVHWRRNRDDQEWVNRQTHEFMQRNDLCRVGDYLCERYGHHVTLESEFKAARAIRRHHDFGHRNGLTRCDHNDPLCRQYGCPDDPEWRGDRGERQRKDR